MMRAQTLHIIVTCFGRTMTMDDTKTAHVTHIDIMRAKKKERHYMALINVP